jgi:hypothetical protein
LALPKILVGVFFVDERCCESKVSVSPEL